MNMSHMTKYKQLTLEVMKGKYLGDKYEYHVILHEWNVNTQDGFSIMSASNVL